MTRSLATILFLALGVGACTQSTDVAPVGGALGKVQTAAPVRPPNPEATPASIPIDRYKGEPEDDFPVPRAKQDLVRGTKVADPEVDDSPGKTKVADPEVDDSPGKTKAADPDEGSPLRPPVKRDFVRGANTAKVGPVAAH
jgi:hypothetical protein